AIRKLEIQPGMGGVKPPLNTAVAADFRGERAYEVDQRGVASRKRWTGLFGPVGADNPGVVAAVGVDLHNRAVFEPGLHSSAREHPVQHSSLEFVLGLALDDRAAFVAADAGVIPSPTRKRAGPEPRL